MKNIKVPIAIILLHSTLAFHSAFAFTTEEQCPDSTFKFAKYECTSTTGEKHTYEIKSQGCATKELDGKEQSYNSLKITQQSDKGDDSKEEFTTCIRGPQSGKHYFLCHQPSKAQDICTEKEYLVFNFGEMEDKFGGEKSLLFAAKYICGKLEEYSYYIEYNKCSQIFLDTP